MSVQYLNAIEGLKCEITVPSVNTPKNNDNGERKMEFS